MIVWMVREVETERLLARYGAFVSEADAEAAAVEAAAGYVAAAGGSGLGYVAVAVGVRGKMQEDRPEPAGALRPAEAAAEASGEAAAVVLAKLIRLLRWREKFRGAPPVPRVRTAEATEILAALDGFADRVLG